MNSSPNLGKIVKYSQIQGQSNNEDCVKYIRTVHCIPGEDAVANLSWDLR